MFSIHINPTAELVETKFGGIMAVNEVGNYIAELKRQFVINKLRSYVMVIDLTDSPIQPQDTVRIMGEHMATMPKAKALAIVTGSSLARMQVRRLFTQPYARITATVEEGRAWGRYMALSQLPYSVCRRAAPATGSSGSVRRTRLAHNRFHVRTSATALCHGQAVEIAGAAVLL